MNKETLIEEIKESRATLLMALDGIPNESRRVPGVQGIWSIKDIMAIIAVWESELINALIVADRNQKPNLVDIEDTYAWDDEQYHLNAPRPYEAVEADFRGVHNMLIRHIQEMDEKKLFDRWLFEWMEGEPLSYLVEEYAVWNEEEFAEAISQWRKEKNL